MSQVFQMLRPNDTKLINNVLLNKTAASKNSVRPIGLLEKLVSVIHERSHTWTLRS